MKDGATIKYDNFVKIVLIAHRYINTQITLKKLYESHVQE